MTHTATSRVAPTIEGPWGTPRTEPVIAPYAALRSPLSATVKSHPCTPPLPAAMTPRLAANFASPAPDFIRGCSPNTTTSNHHPAPPITATGVNQYSPHQPGHSIRHHGARAQRPHVTRTAGRARTFGMRRVLASVRKTAAPHATASTQKITPMPCTLHGDGGERNRLAVSACQHSFQKQALARSHACEELELALCLSREHAQAIGVRQLLLHRSGQQWCWVRVVDHVKH